MKIIISVEYLNELEYVISDNLRVQQVLLNLLSNALKYSLVNGLIKITV